MALRTGDRITAVVEKMVHGGRGLCRTDQGVIFVEAVLPGERVEIKITSAKKDFSQGSCLSILEPSPERREAPCPWAYNCGGCHLQHTSIEYQRLLKREVLKDTLSRVGKIDPGLVREVVPSPRETHYRNTVQFRGDGKRMGFFRRGSRDIVEIETCLIADHRINAVYHLLREEPFQTLILRTDGERIVMMGDSPERIELEASLLGLDGMMLASGGLPQRSEGDLRLFHHLREKTFQVSAGSFYQVNRWILEKLVDHLEDKLKDSSGELWDLFGGVGLFGILFANQFQKVSSFEISASAQADLKANLELNGISNMEGIRWDGELGFQEASGSPEVILLDPPRQGITKKLARDILSIEPKQILYISCEPAALGRDLRILLDSGLYRLVDVTPFEMFPQTYHLESCAHLVRLSS